MTLVLREINLSILFFLCISEEANSERKTKFEKPAALKTTEENFKDKNYIKKSQVLY